MANPNPYKARQARKRRKTPGTVKQLTAVLWEAITKLEDYMHATTDADEKRRNTAELTRLTHALSQAAGQYLKALEVGEFEKRLEALEQEINKNEPR
jgi:uncharacterized small protein (DUF1192 family)